MTEKTEKPKTMRMPPVVTLDAKFFWDAAAKGELVCERCSNCDTFRYPPRPMCPECHSVEREVVQLSGKGTVYSWIRPRHPKPFGFDEPPIAALITLEEGFRMVSNLIDVEFEDVTAGMPVEVDFAPTLKNKQVPVFRPAKG